MRLFVKGQKKIINQVAYPMLGKIKVSFFGVKYFLILGIAINLFVTFLYGINGYSNLILLGWFTSILITSLYFFLNKGIERVLTLKNIIDMLILILIFSPIYLAFIYDIPVQINSDEITLMIVEKGLTNEPKPDLFALSNYFGFPAFIYIVLGKLGMIFGGINLQNMRILHALSGLLIIVVSYFFFKTIFSSRFLGFIGALLLGGNHALIAISRMAYKDNTALFIELLALGLLLKGFHSNSYRLLYFGGVIAGFSFYTYYPARATFLLWVVFLFVITLIRRNTHFLKKASLAFLIPMLGIFVVASPLALSTLRDYEKSMDYQRHTSLLFLEGRELMRTWYGKQTVEEGVKQNIVNGLTVFNNNKPDHGFKYFNPDHGFVDPLSGVLIWIGFLHLIFKRKTETDYFMLSSFIVLLMIYSFIITKSPDYTRLLVIIPFAVYMVLQAWILISWVLKKVLLQHLSGYKLVPATLLIGGTILIISFNLSILSDFVFKGLNYGDVYGGTGRYVEQRNKVPNYSFFLAADNNYRYYSWGESGGWRDWLGFFAREDQNVKVLAPSDFMDNLSSPPFAVFMAKSVWIKSQADFKIRYPKFSLSNIMPDGSLVAVEVINEI